MCMDSVICGIFRMNILIRVWKKIVYNGLFFFVFFFSISLGPQGTQLFILVSRNCCQGFI